MEAHKNRRLEFKTEPLSKIQKNERNIMEKIKTPNNPELNLRIPERLTSKLLVLLNLSSWVLLKKKISVFEAKTCLKTLNNARSILKTYLKTNFPFPEKKKLSISQKSPNIELEFLNQIRNLLKENAEFREQDLEIRKQCATSLQTLKNELTLQSEEISIKCEEIKILKEALLKENEIVKFWKKKFAESITNFQGTQAITLKNTSFNAFYHLNPPELWDEESDNFFPNGDICHNSPLKNQDLSLIELRINDYEILKQITRPTKTSHSEETLPRMELTYSEKNSDKEKITSKPKKRRKKGKIKDSI